jgi:hypothetical protein
MSGTDYVFSAAEVPVNYPIAQHIEMSFLPAPPRQLFFGCMKPSEKAGGETALAHFGKVYEDLPADLRSKFLSKGIRYERRHKKVGSYYTYDVSDMVGWPELFGTSDKKQVEALCAAEGVNFSWEGTEGNETFVCITHADACQLHPVSQKPIWFNHTQVFHWTTFPCELWFAFCRTHDWRLLLHCFIVTLFCVVKYGILRHKMSLHCSFGDSTPITIQEMTVVRNTIHKNMIFFRWAKGDLLMIDNLSTSHGRQPTYDSGRKIVVSWAEPWNKLNLLHGAADGNSILTMKTVAEEGLDGDNESEEEEEEEETPVSTPEQTLTKQEAKVLQKALNPHTAVAREAAKILEGMMDAQKEKRFQEQSLRHKRSVSQPSFTESCFWKKIE